ncbi:putative lipid II flippase FtsW [bioreactor metagenome]|uniref:peptidoglycan glycosyltransferase n=1 Tax=bioreactor metagenome TaxID=1076179 RepID=A0A645EZG3_9ZZZZ
MSAAQLTLDQLPADAVPDVVESATAPAGWNVGRILVRGLSLFAFVAFWQVAAQYRLHLGIVTFQNVPAPSEVLPALWNLLQSPKVVDHVLNSLYRVFGGFIGATLILLIFAALIWRGYYIALHANDKFGTLLAAGITTQIAVQVVINLFVVTGLCPVTGASLPFFSYGGTALLIQLAEMGILLAISRRMPAPKEG